MAFATVQSDAWKSGGELKFTILKFFHRDTQQKQFFGLCLRVLIWFEIAIETVAPLTVIRIRSAPCSRRSRPFAGTNAPAAASRRVLIPSTELLYLHLRLRSRDSRFKESSDEHLEFRLEFGLRNRHRVASREARYPNGVWPVEPGR